MQYSSSPIEKPLWLWSYGNLQLPMQSVPITTDVVSLNLDQDEVHNIMCYGLFVTCDRSVVFSGYSCFLHQ